MCRCTLYTDQWAFVIESLSSFTVTFTITNITPQENSVSCHGKEVQNSASDFYPGIVIRNTFEDLIICIFSFRVKSIKGGLIPCSTVLTKCFHIFFQLGSLFHFWKILCNYFLMLLKTPQILQRSGCFYFVLLGRVSFNFSFY